MRSILYLVTVSVVILFSSFFVACDKFPNLPIAGTSGSSDLGMSAKDIVPASKVGELAQEVGNRLYAFELWRKEELVEKDTEILRQVEVGPYRNSLAWLELNAWQKVDDPLSLDIGQLFRRCGWN